MLVGGAGGGTFEACVSPWCPPSSLLLPHYEVSSFLLQSPATITLSHARGPETQNHGMNPLKPFAN